MVKLLKENTRKLIIIALLMLCFINIFLTDKFFINKDVDAIEETTVLDKKQFAMYYETENGYAEYTESDIFPEGYELNLEKSNCVDNNGYPLTGTISASGNNVTVTSNKTAYCNLYFDKETPMNIEKLCKKYSDLKMCIQNEENNLIKINNLFANIYHKGEVDAVFEMYRYQGTTVNNNYICFGTTDKEKCIGDPDKYMYRIIGITTDETLYAEYGQLKLIKETFVKEVDGEGNTTSDGFAWNALYQLKECTDGKCPEWGNNDLYYRLNGSSVNKTKYNNIFVDNSYYEYLSTDSEWYDKISTHQWLYGDTTSNGSYNGDNLYGIESGKEYTTHSECSANCTISSNWKNVQYKWIDNDQITINAKIGLMYLHDYYYAYRTNEEDAGIPGTANALNSWIFFQKDNYNVSNDNEWLVSRYGKTSSYFYAWNITSRGTVNGSSMNNLRGIRPVFYLKSSITIKDGDGSGDNPYIIE